MIENLPDTNVGKIEYISKQDAVDDLHTQLMYRMGSDDMKRRLDDWVTTLPSADVAPVVRCENCIHWSDSNQCARPELSGSRWHDPKYFDTYPDDFCSYGERREE